MVIDTFSVVSLPDHWSVYFSVSLVFPEAFTLNFDSNNHAASRLTNIDSKEYNN
jgi:hypothetical protein